MEIILLSLQDYGNNVGTLTKSLTVCKMIPVYTYIGGKEYIG